jgi:hypothetical protein
MFPIYLLLLFLLNLPTIESGVLKLSTISIYLPLSSVNSIFFFYINALFCFFVWFLFLFLGFSCAKIEPCFTSELHTQPVV